MTREKKPSKTRKTIKNVKVGRPRNKAHSRKNRYKVYKGNASVFNDPTATGRERYFLREKKVATTGVRSRMLTFEEARRVVRAEYLASKNDYTRWWIANLPARLPRNPQIRYKGEWKGWNDFLGNNNDLFPIKHKSYRDFFSARDFARSLKFRTKEEWMEAYEKGMIPDDIPKHPSKVYGLTFSGKPKRGGHWVSWKDWLGFSIVDQMIAEKSKVDVLVIIIPDGVPNNVYGFVSMRDFEFDIRRKIVHDKLRVVKAYYINTKFDWGYFIDSRWQKYYNMNGLYLIQNINDILYMFDMQMDSFTI